MNFPSSSDDEPCSSKPNLSSCSLTCGFTTAALVSRASRSTISRGIPAGPTIAPHGTSEYCGKPASAIVGASGKRWLRRCSSVASTLSLPSLARFAPGAVLAIAKCRRPATKSTISGASPL
jgi:hypothetical protein